MKKLLRKFRRARAGLAYVWGVAACTLAFIPLIFWILSAALDKVAASLLGGGVYSAMYTLSGTTLLAWTAAKFIVSALPFLILLATLLWSAVNAKARSYEQ